MLTLTVLVDNQARRGLRAAWGLSVAVEGSERLLFDTGPAPEVLEHNARHLGISLDFDYVVLSHQHWDHVGGISAVNAGVVCVPEPGTVAGELCSSPREFKSGFLTTGTLGKEIREQALIVKGEEKTALLVGCSHPGVDNLLAKAVELVDTVDVVLGGFHLLNSSSLRVREVARRFRELDVEEVYPMHCTGAEAKKILKKELGSIYREGYAGMSIQL